MFNFFATCAKLLEGLLREELIVLGAESVKETVAGVHFSGDLALGYRVCLWSRLANQVLLKLEEFDAADSDQLYQAIQHINWSEHLDVKNTFRIEVDGQHQHIRHPHFIAQRAKDAIVDQFRERYLERPQVVSERPDVSLHLHVDRIHFTLSLNFSGESLHRRGYRLEAGKAPLKETLAAAILLRAGWPKQLQHSPAVLYDPMCGTGTLLAEAALMAFDIAPGLSRSYFGFLGWQQHRPAMWQKIRQEALDRREEGLARQDVILVGTDIHPQAIRKSQENVQRVGLADRMTLMQMDATLVCPEQLKDQKGLLVCNPPYGERLTQEAPEDLGLLFKRWGQQLQQHFVGWQAAIFSGAPETDTKQLGLRAHRTYPLFNGTIPCKLYLFAIEPQRFMVSETPQQRLVRQVQAILEKGLSSAAQMLANRLRKNIKNLQHWAHQQGMTCYRIYDSDLPEYAVAVDWYEGKWLHVQEYQAPKEIDPKKTQQHLLEVIAVLQQTMQLPLESIFIKVRQRQKGASQYEKLQEQGEFYKIQEGAAQFWVNFTDYLDTGIFLDHRGVRQQVAQAAVGKTLLNLFAYTCTASVQAALAGAKKVTSVDLSRTYLEWGQRNFELNQIRPAQYELVQADCLQWLAENKQRYDVIFIDPPTFSNSKRMEETWDVQRDHVALIKQAMQSLKPLGVLFFSCNLRNFKLDQTALAEYHIISLSHKTLQKDFARQANRHHVFMVRYPN